MHLSTILSLGQHGETEDKILFGKGIFYFGGNRGRGQVGGWGWMSFGPFSLVDSLPSLGRSF